MTPTHNQTSILLHQRRSLFSVATGLTTFLLCAGGCGVKGPPLPPLKEAHQEAEKSAVPIESSDRDTAADPSTSTVSTSSSGVSTSSKGKQDKPQKSAKKTGHSR